MAKEFDIVDPAGRKQAMRHFNWTDHGILRLHWHNFDQVADGVFRSNHPNHDRFAKYAQMGIKTVLTLRGAPHQPQFLFEQESCEALGLTLRAIPMSARNAPRQHRLIELIDAFRQMEKPFLIHCKSGADRTGLAAGLYLMVEQGAPVEAALDQLSFRYIHIRKTRTGVLDHFFRMYAARNAQSPIGIEDWIRTEYDRDALTQSFAEHQNAQRFWEGWR